MNRAETEAPDTSDAHLEFARAEPAAAHQLSEMDALKASLKMMELELAKMRQAAEERERELAKALELHREASERAKHAERDREMMAEAKVLQLEQRLCQQQRECEGARCALRAQEETAVQLRLELAKTRESGSILAGELKGELQRARQDGEEQRLQGTWLRRDIEALAAGKAAAEQEWKGQLEESRKELQAARAELAGRMPREESEREDAKMQACGEPGGWVMEVCGVAREACEMGRGRNMICRRGCALTCCAGWAWRVQKRWRRTHAGGRR